MTAFERKLKNCSEPTIPTKFVFGAMKSTQELEKQEKKNYATNLPWSSGTQILNIMNTVRKKIMQNIDAFPFL